MWVGHFVFSSLGLFSDDDLAAFVQRVVLCNRPQSQVSENRSPTRPQNVNCMSRHVDIFANFLAGLSQIAF